MALSTARPIEPSTPFLPPAGFVRRSRASARYKMRARSFLSSGVQCGRVSAINRTPRLNMLDTVIFLKHCSGSREARLTQPVRVRARQPPAFSEMASESGEAVRERGCYTDFSRVASLETQARFRAGFCVLRLAQQTHFLFTPYNDSQVSHRPGLAVDNSQAQLCLWMKGDGRSLQPDVQITGPVPQARIADAKSLQALAESLL